MENSTNKVIIVIGKMGHGKSTFVKMLVNDQDKNKIQVGGGDKSVTSKCTLYKVDTPNLKMNEQLYIIDTPGLDSEDQIILVLEQLDNCIVQKKCEIVGLAYVLDIAVIRQKKDDEKLFKFFKHFKLRHSIKKQIFFCVLSKFDKYYDLGEQNQEKFDIFRKNFADNGLESSWDRKIQWMSQPVKSYQRFLKIANPKNKHEAYPIYKNQWISLKNNITNIITTKKYLPFNQYDSDLNYFESLMIKQLQSTIINSKQTVLKQIQFNTDLIQKQLPKMGFKEASTTLALSAALSLINPIFIAVGLYTVFRKRYLYSKGQLSKQIEKNLMIEAKLEAYQLKKLGEGIIFEQDKMIIKKSLWFDKIISGQIQNEKKEKKKLIFTEQNQKFEERKILPGKMSIKFEVRTPTIKQYQQFLLQQSLKYYGTR